MSCPTCSGTMQGVGHAMFHCSRCGTYKNADGSYTVPALVTRCREFQTTLGDIRLSQHRLLWHRLGVRESINTPENRGD